MADMFDICLARSLYWNSLRADALPPGVDRSVFDMGVNLGIWRSARLLQQTLGFTGERKWTARQVQRHWRLRTGSILGAW
jgi:lysozyme family protein